MKLVIDIPDEDYNIIIANADFYKANHWGVAEVWDAIVSGTPLPKGHGRLIDADTLDTRCGRCAIDCAGDCDKCSDNVVSVEDIRRATSIIDADNSEVD